MARLKGTLVHLLTYDHDNGDDEEDYDEDNEDEDKDEDDDNEDEDKDDRDEDKDEDEEKDENTGAQKGLEGTWSTYPLATCLTP